MWLPDRVVKHLREVVGSPDLGGTQYRLIGELGHGGMGSVYLVHDAALDRELALKVLNVLEADGGIADRLTREARIIARLEHPGIVPVHDVGTLPDGRVFYTMKRVHGTSLDRYRSESTALTDLLRVFQKICDAVAFGHSQGVIHRDLKPSNIMVGAFGEVLVMDWGVAKWISPREPEEDSADPRAVVRHEGQDPREAQIGTIAEGTVDGTVIGTPGFMAPEQALGRVREIDERADVYSLGTILYFLLTGGYPAAPRSETAQSTLREEPEGSRPSEAQTRLGIGIKPEDLTLDASVPRSLREICLKATQYRAEDRYPGVQSLAADVSRFLDALPVRAYQEPFHEKALRLASKYRTPLLLVLTYLIVRLLVLIYGGR